MKIQIYTMQSPEEALAAARLGVDHVGITPSDIGLPGEVSFTVAREIVEAVKRAATSVALTVETDLGAIEAMVQVVRPWAVDSLTHTNHPLPGGGFRKDLERIRQFVAAARGG